MQINNFKLERYFAAHEFSARYLLSTSDCESLSLSDLLALADPETSALWARLSLGYTESQGHPLLRETIAGQYAGVKPADVLAAIPEEAIFIAMNACLSAGDEVIVTWPAYQSLYEIAGAVGCQVVRWPLTVSGGAWRLDLDALPGLISSRTRLLIVNFPHNPTGYLPTAGEYAAIVDTAARHGMILFSDEMYRLLELDPAARLPSACEVYERAITLTGLSKSYGLPGLRVGWLATRERGLMERFIAFKDYTTICGSAPSEILGIIALRAAETIVARNLALLRSNLAAADRFFARHPGMFEWPRPLGGSVAFPRLLGGTSVGEFARRLLAQRSAMLVTDAQFDFAGNHFRLGLGRAGFPQALAVLEDFLVAEGS